MKRCWTSSLGTNRTLDAAMLRAFVLFGAVLGMMGCLGSAWAAADEDAVRPLGISLEEIAYPYPVQFLDLVIEGQAVRIAWDFLGPHIDEQVLDFYHASQYLARAAAAIFKHEQEREQGYQRPARIEEKPNSPHFLVSYA